MWHLRLDPGDVDISINDSMEALKEMKLVDIL